MIFFHLDWTALDLLEFIKNGKKVQKNQRMIVNKVSLFPVTAFDLLPFFPVDSILDLSHNHK